MTNDSKTTASACATVSSSATPTPGARQCARSLPLIVAAASVFAGNAALAASATWNSAGTSVNWTSTTNWGGNAAPGGTTINNPDTATFASAVVEGVGSSGNPIIVDTSPTRYINYITFDTANAGAFTIGATSGNGFTLTNGGAITMTSSVVNSQTINAPVAGMISNGSYSIVNNAAATSAVMTLGGTLTSAATSGTTRLTLDGTNAGRNLLSGSVVNNGGALVSLIKSGTGKWVLSGTNSYTGATRVAGGKLVLDFSAVGAPTSDIVSSASGLALGNATASTAGADTLILQGKTGTANSQTFGGTVIISGGAGHLVLQPGAGGGTINVNLGALPNTHTSGATLDITTNGQTVTATGTVSANSTLIANAVTLNGTDFATISGGNLVAATYTANGATTMTASKIIDMSNGSSSLAASRSIASLRFNNTAATTLTIGTGQTLTLSSPDVTAAAILVTSNVGSNKTVITGGTLAGISARDLSLIQNNTQGILQIDSVIGGGANVLTKSGLGTVVTTAANTYTGKTIINEGTLQFGKTASLYNGSAASWAAASIGVGPTATLALNVGGSGEFAAGDVATLLDNTHLGASTAVTGLQSGATLGFDTTNSSGSFAYGSAIANPNSGVNALNVTKLGGGTLSLSNAGNSYTGATTVQSGTLSLSGGSSNNIAASSKIIVGDTSSHGSAVLNVTGLSGGTLQVANSQTLGGHGTIVGNVSTAGSSSVIAPGNGTGTITVDGDFTLGSGRLGIELGASPTDYDQLVITPAHTLSLTGGLLQLSASGGLANGDVFYLIDNQGSGSAAATGTFRAATINGLAATGSLLQGTSFTAGAYTFTISYDAVFGSAFAGSGNDVALRVGSAVPEPATLALVAISGIGMMSRRKRR